MELSQKEINIKKAIILYEADKVNIVQAAEIAELSVEHMLHFISERKLR
tara:strand:+ start:1011 stop:1157 length:147 start_codon:yes stop_codon:yes gene_type:complete